MREERACRRVEGGDRCHIFIREREVENVDILYHTISVCGLRQHNNTALNIPAEHDLSSGLAIFFADIYERFILEQTASALTEGRPRLTLYAVLVHVLLGDLLLIEDMSFHLIYRDPIDTFNGRRRFYAVE